MRSATRVTVATFGAVAALAGIEHGVGEVLQGNVGPGSIVFESWAGSEIFAIVSGEPAMTVIPNLLASGILSILVSLLFLLWAIRFVHRKHGGVVLVGLAVVLLLVGGGFGPPLLGIILGVVATRIGAPLSWWRAHLPTGVRRLLSTLWPWSLAAALAAWIFLMPGTIIIDYTLGVPLADATIYATVLTAFAFLMLAIIAGFAREVEQGSLLRVTR